MGFYFNGEVLKECREKKNMTQAEVARHLGTHQQTISRHETGGLLPSSEFLILYRNLYNVSLDEIVFGK